MNSNEGGGFCEGSFAKYSYINIEQCIYIEFIENGKHDEICMKMKWTFNGGKEISQLLLKIS